MDGIFDGHGYISLCLHIGVDLMTSTYVSIPSPVRYYHEQLLLSVTVAIPRL